MISYPAGVCIQEFSARIQNDENSVPTATMAAAKKWAHGGTSLRPNRRTPRKLASRKKAVRPSYAIKGPTTFAAVSEKRLQLVPNWNGMTIPETTPRPNEMAKIRVQNTEIRKYV